MQFPEASIDNLRGFGYTADEAHFLYLVATHSGYFSTRQYLQFTGAESGDKSMAFTQKVLGKGHAIARLLLRNGRAYHLFSRPVYRAIGRENLRNRREHSVEHIRTRLVILDFVLAHLAYRYLETEADKVDYFCRELHISKLFLPTKRYSGAIHGKATERYFVDKFPLFFASESSLPAVVTFSFVDPGLLSLDSFNAHLLAYASLFSALPKLRFLYIATRPTHIEAARKLFLALANRAANTDPRDEILRYFRLRKLWETKQCGKLSNDDMEFLKRAQKQFNDARTDIRFYQWWEGRVSSEIIRAEFRDLTPPREVQFDAELVDGQAALFEARPRTRTAALPAKPVKYSRETTLSPPFGSDFGAHPTQTTEK